MTREELRDYLIEKKAINDFEDEDPFVGTWLSTMVELKKKIEQDLIKKAKKAYCRDCVLDVCQYDCEYFTVFGKGLES